MGNENSSMCSCYDADKEKQHQESNIFQQRPELRQSKLQQYKNLNSAQFSQYSYGKSTAKYQNPNMAESTFNSNNSNRANGPNKGPGNQDGNSFIQSQQKQSGSNWSALGDLGRMQAKNNNQFDNSNKSSFQSKTGSQYHNNRFFKKQEGHTGSSLNDNMTPQNENNDQYPNNYFQQQPNQDNLNSGMRPMTHRDNYQSNLRGMDNGNQAQFYSNEDQNQKGNSMNQNYNQKLRRGNTETKDNRDHYASVGYQSSRSNKSHASKGNNAKSMKSLGNVDGYGKKKTLHINDYKQFKKIKNVEDRYLLHKTLGQGAFGVVKLCQHKVTQQLFAIKIMEKKAIQKQRIYVELLQNELTILGEKSHPNLIRIIDLMEDKTNYYVVSEYVKGGELFKRLCKVNTFTENNAADIIYQIMQGLNYMHQQQVTHRDMKPENVLLVSEDVDNFDVKIADLGFAQKFDKETGLDLVLGTPLYMAPELVRRERYSEKVDVWSLGCITFQLLSGKTPFDGKNIQKINENILYKQITFKERGWRNVSANAKDFILQCLERNQFKRPSIEELFDHPWIDEIPEQKDQVNEENQLNIQRNLIQYQNCSDFQKIVLSLVSGLSSTSEELEQLQKEFLRLDKDKNGTLNKYELEQMTHSKLNQRYNIDWDEIIEQCDYNGDGVIDFQEFISACIDRKVLKNQKDVKMAFQILDTNKDNKISLEDFDDLFNSYGGSKMDNDVWGNLLAEADKNGDGVVSYEEFADAMGNLLRKSLNKKRRHTKQ